MNVMMLENETDTFPDLSGMGPTEENNGTDIIIQEINYGNIVDVILKILVYSVGTVGNILVIFMILFLGEYKKVTHWYVLQLALADLLFLQTLPFTISEKLQGYWIYPDWMCAGKQTILFFNYYSSILFLMIMAIDRYMAVCHGLSNRVQRLRSRQASLVITGVTWLSALLLCVPVIMYGQPVGNYPKCTCTLHFPKDPHRWCVDEGFNTNETEVNDCINEIFPDIHGDACQPVGGETSGDYSYDLSSFYLSGDYSGGGLFPGMGSGVTPDGASEVIPAECFYDPQREGWGIFLFFNFIVMFVVPLIIVTVCYGLIVLRLKKTMVGGRKSSSGDGFHSSTDGTKGVLKSKPKKSSNRSSTEKKRVTIMCAVLVLLFAVCWLPFHSVHLAKHVGIAGVKASVCAALGVATSTLAYLNSALNPYLYNFLGTFKKRIRQVQQHQRMQTFLSATGLTKLGGRSGSLGSSSEGSKMKRSSMANEGRSASIPNESKPLKMENVKTTRV